MFKKTQFLILVFIVILSISCKCQDKKQNIYWSGSLFTQNDSNNGWLFYLANYIEINDSGEVIIMTRKEFQSPMEFYLIEIPDSVRKSILKLAMNPKMYKKTTNKLSCFYDGLTYSLRIHSESGDRKISYIPPQGNEIQRSFVKIMMHIFEHPVIKAKTSRNLNEYEKITEKDIIISSGPLPEIMKDTLFFSPPG